MEAEAVVIGAGVVGLAVARTLSRRGLETVVLERLGSFGQGASSRNSEVIHAGIYYREGSLKERLCIEGKAKLYDYCGAKGISHRQCGKLVVATSDDQIPKLRDLEMNAKRANVEVERLGKDACRRLEPELHCVEALLSPTTGIVDSHAFMEALAYDAEANGATIAYRSRVRSAAEEKGGGTAFQVEDDNGDLFRLTATKVAVNAGGLHAGGLLEEPGRRVTFAKGNYFSLQGGGNKPFSRLVYPLPDPRGGLGIHATVGLDGAVKFGPDVEFLDDVTDPDELDYRVDERRAPAFYEAIRRYYPGLRDGDLLPDYAGVRPKVREGDFLILRRGGTTTTSTSRGGGFISLLGIESPGLTAALALADYVADLAFDS